MEQPNGASVEPTEGEKLLAAGVFVMLGGSPVKLIIDGRAVVTLEAKYGSILALGEKLQLGERGPFYSVIIDVLSAAARGLPPGIDVAELVDLSPEAMADYGEKIMAAFKQAGMWSNGQGNGAGPTTGRSPGSGSTMRRSSASGSRQRRSGR